MKIATVFSGVGAIERACINVFGEENVEIVFACDNGERYLKETKEELDEKMIGLSSIEKQQFIKDYYYNKCKTNYVKETYFANYNITEDKWFDDIRFLDGTRFKGKVDLLCGGSPCQSFSIIGKRAGLNDARGTLFYDFARLVKEIHPKYFIFENVPGILNHDGGHTWDVINQIFESLNYHIYYSVLNSINFGIPQDRKRFFAVGFLDEHVNFEFPVGHDIGNITMFDFLDQTIDRRHYLGKKGFEFVTNPKYKNRARVNQPIIQTQKANQQFNWNGDFVFEQLDYNRHTPDILTRAYVGQYNGNTGVIRQLTYSECFKLMGFPNDFRIVVPNIKAYRQAGNSIVVPVLEAIVRNIIEALEEHHE